MSDDKKTSRWAKTWAYRKAQKAVGALLDSPKKLLALVEKVSAKSESNQSGAIAKTLESVKVLVRLVTAYAKGDYRSIAIENLAIIIAALVYFVMPLDAIPDFIAVLGLADDAALLAWTWGAVNSEVERFLLWELEQQALDQPEINKLEGPQQGQQKHEEVESED